MEFEFVMIYLILCTGVAAWANAWNKRPLAWFIASVLISPLIMGIILALTPHESAAFDAENVYEGIPYQQDERDVVAMIDGAKVHFPSMDQFKKTIDARRAPRSA